MARIREKTLKFPGLDNVYTFADEADQFDANVACAVGEYRIYNGDLYCCTTPHTGAWDASHFKAVKMGNEVSGLNAAITEYVVSEETVLTRWDGSFSSGKYYEMTVGQTPTLTDNSSSIYTPNAIDVSDYIGGTLRIDIEGITPSGGRMLGFVDDNGKTVQAWAFGTIPWIATSSGWYWETPIVSGSLLISSNNNYPTFTVSVKKIISYNKSEIDSMLEPIKRYTGMLDGSYELDDYPLGKSTNRAFTEQYDAKIVAGVSVSACPDGYQSSIRFYNGSGGTKLTDFTPNAQSFDTPNGYNFGFQIYFKRNDNGNITASDISTIKSNVTITVTDSNVTKNSIDVAFVDSVSGNDNNDGLSRSNSFATIQKAIDRGFKHILVKEGTYTGIISLSDADGVHIEIDKYYSSFDASTANTNPKVVIDCNNSTNDGVIMLRCSNCKLEGIEVKNSNDSAFVCRNSESIIFVDCVAHDSGNHGFEIVNANVDFINCGAYNIGTYGGSNHKDGFNLHGTGTQNLTNCWANYCEDDGVSHHDACEGFVDGGEWHHCGKGGVCTPTHGAKVNIQNVYAHDCGYGIYAGNDIAELAKTFNITNCVCLDNTTKDISVGNNTANIWNCIYDTIEHTGVGTNNILTAS